MPTAKPRIQVTLPPHQHELLRRLAKLQNRSMAAVIAELFDEVHPVLERVAVVLQAATRAQESMKEGLRKSTEDTERELRPFVAQALGQLDLLSMDFARAAKPVEVPPQAAPIRRGDPRPVTRGSGPGATAQRTPTRKHAKRVKSPKRRAGR